MGEHVMFARETAWGTYVPPDATGVTGGAIPVESFNVAPSIDFMTVEDTGPGGKGRMPGAPGALSLGGDLSSHLYPQGIGKLLRTVMTGRIATPTTETTGLTITASTVASPTVLTVNSTTGFKVGDPILIAGHTGGTPSLNGIHYITAIISATQLALDVALTVAGTWSAGTGKRSVYRNALLFNDNVPYDSLSFQKYFDPARAELLRGVKMTSFEVGVRSREFATFNASFVGKDATKAGGLWADQSAAPAITPYGPGFYPPVIYDALKFYQAAIRIGGSVSLVGGELLVTGGVARTEIDNVSFTVDLGLGTDAYGIVMDDRTVQQIDDGPRTINLTFEPNFKSVWFEFYDLWKANPQLPLILEAYFRGPQIFTVPTPTYLEYKFTFPNCRISSAPTPDINAAYGLKRQTVTAQAAIDSVTNQDLGVVINSPENYSI